MISEIHIWKVWIQICRLIEKNWEDNWLEAMVLMHVEVRSLQRTDAEAVISSHKEDNTEINEEATKKHW